MTRLAQISMNAVLPMSIFIALPPRKILSNDRFVRARGTGSPGRRHHRASRHKLKITQSFDLWSHAAPLVFVVGVPAVCFLDRHAIEPMLPRRWHRRTRGERH